MKKKLLLVLALLILAATATVTFAEQAGDSRIEVFLAQQAEKQKDPWVLAILDAGARNVSWDGNTATFFLRSFNPELKQLGSYAKSEDPAAWRRQAVENITGYSLEAKVTFEEDGSVSKKQATALMNLVKQEARSAKGALGKKDWTKAMTDLMFCSPTTEKEVTAASLMTTDSEFADFINAREEILPCESPSEWAPLFYLQRGWEYTLNQGPHSIRMKWDGADPVRFLEKAYDAVTGSLAATPGADRPKEESLSYLWRSTLAETAVSMKKGRLVSQSAQFDLDELLAGKMPEGYAAYFAAFQPETYYTQLVEGYRKLPESASQPLPKTGVISQAKKGRSVVVKVPKDGRNTYVQLRDADTGVIQGEAFILPGKNVNIKVPEGVYIVQYATGSTWYGTAETFGPLGDYSASGEFTVAKKKWTLTSGREQEGITLHPITAADMAPTEDRSVKVPGILETDVPLRESYPENNPVLEGISSTTGLPASGEAYTPIVMVLDNAEEAYPHWGVKDADIIFQVPNAGAGATKLLGLFADHYPEQAGPVRSGRTSMLPAVTSLDAAFAFAGGPPLSGGQADLNGLMMQFGMNKGKRVYNLLNTDVYKERVKGTGSHNLSCHVKAIHDHLTAEGVEFEERPFLFADEPRTTGKTANIIRVLHRGDDPKAGSNSASRAVFKYDAASGEYTRDNSSGAYTDRNTGEEVTFANVIVLRVRFAYDRNYVYLDHHLTGSGCAEIFQNGKYVRGAWTREEADSRLVLVDEDGSELRLQRGKSFIVITNDVSDVVYSE